MTSTAQTAENDSWRKRDSGSQQPTAKFVTGLQDPTVSISTETTDSGSPPHFDKCRNSNFEAYGRIQSEKNKGLQPQGWQAVGGVPCPVGHDELDPLQLQIIKVVGLWERRCLQGNILPHPRSKGIGK